MDLCLQPGRPQGAIATTPFHHWLLPDGTRWLLFYRTGSGYLLRFPDLADFEIAADSLSVTCHPAPEVNEETSRHLYLNQVLPLVMSKQGKLVFHASAVDIAGVAVAFVGESGRGKSTLAARFAHAGFGFLSDDGLVIDAHDDGFLALPGHPSLRLWKDSEEAIVAGGIRMALPVQYTDKGRFLAGPAMAYCRQPRPLRRVYFLGDGSASRLVIHPVGAADAVAEWLRHAFMLDVEEKSLLATHFDRLVSLAGHVEGYRLDFPRRFEMLDAVMEAILVDVQIGAGAV